MEQTSSMSHMVNGFGNKIKVLINRSFENTALYCFIDQKIEPFKVYV